MSCSWQLASKETKAVFTSAASSLPTNNQFGRRLAAEGSFGALL
jgi:hypothetical protein